MLLICLALCFCSAQDAPEKDAVTKVLALEHAWDQAEQARDIMAMGPLFDSTMLYVDFDGRLLTKTSFLAQAQAAKAEQQVAEGMEAHQFGSTVVVVGVYRARGIEKGKAYLRHGRFMDTWVYVEGKWSCVVSQSTPIVGMSR